LIIDRRILACVALSVVAHVAFARAMQSLPKRVDVAIKRVISIRVVSPPPAPEPPPEPALPQLAPTPTPVPLERARPHHTRQVAEDAAPKDVPPPEHPPAPGANIGGPVFGISMESTSQAGGGPSMPIGNPANPGAAHAGGAREGTGNASVEPVPAYEVTTMPLPQRRCSGKYTDEAMQAGVEGTVVLDLVIGADGRVRDVHVVEGLGHGLDEAAIAAMKACPFSPGRRGEEAVPVRIREFKVRFFQNDE
jgi:periplasmic protein TonB